MLALCPGCNRPQEPKKLHWITLNILVRAADKGQAPPHELREQLKAKNSKVPRAIRRVFPKMNEKHYAQLKNTPALYENAKVCENCYLFYTRDHAPSPLSRLPPQAPAKTQESTLIPSPAPKPLLKLRRPVKAPSETHFYYERPPPRTAPQAPPRPALSSCDRAVSVYGGSRSSSTLNTRDSRRSRISTISEASPALQGRIIDETISSLRSHLLCLSAKLV